MEVKNANQEVIIKRPWVTFIIMMLGWFAMMLSLGANTTAFPYLTASLGLPAAYLSWMSVTYTMGAAILAPLMGRIGDLIGLKKMSLLGLSLFTIAVVGLGFGRSFIIVLLARLLQGLSVACVVPSCMAFAGRFFSGKETAKAYTILSAVGTGGNIIAPMIAGVLCDGPGYQWVYYIGIAISAIALILVAIVLPKIPVVPQQKGRFDFVGACSLCLSIGGLMVLPTIGSQFGWTHPLAFLCIALFVVFMIVFLVAENRVKHPLLRLSMLKSKSFLIPSVYALVISGIVTVFMYMVTYYVVYGRGMASSISGSWTTFTMIVMTAAAVIVTKLMGKLNWKTCAFIHVISAIVACVVFSFVGPESPVAILFVGGAFLGLSGCFNSPLPQASALADVGNQERGVASGTFKMFGDLSGPLETAIFIPMLSTIGLTAAGKPNFAVSFSKVSLMLLIPCVIALVLCFVYPKHDPKTDTAK